MSSTCVPELRKPNWNCLVTRAGFWPAARHKSYCVLFAFRPKAPAMVDFDMGAREKKAHARAVDDALSARIAAELPRLRRHAASLLYSHADAEDLVQDCLETALLKRDSLQDTSRLRSWL